jgi:Domain of unknown function (DUF4384)
MKSLVVMAAMSCVVYAQDSGLRARELFYSPPPDAVPAKKSVPARPPVAKQATPPSPKQTPVPVVNAANVPLGLRYSVMKRDAAAKFIEVDQDATFRSGDRIRLNVDSNTTGYLYVVMQGSSGNWRLLFPSADVEGGNNRIEKGSSQQIPPGEKGQFLFDEQAGTEKLFLVLSRRPETDLDKLIYSITGTSTEGDRKLVASAKIGADVVSRLRDEVKSRDLVFEKVDEVSLQYDGTTDVKIEKATYVVNPSRGEDARLVVDVALKHGK